MKYRSSFRRELILLSIIGTGVLLTFVGGCSTRLYLDLHNDQPAWLNYGVLTAFGGLNVFFWGLLAVAAAVKQWTIAKHFGYKARAILILFFGMLILFLAAFVLRMAVRYFIGLS